MDEFRRNFLKLTGLNLAGGASAFFRIPMRCRAQGGMPPEAAQRRSLTPGHLAQPAMATQSIRRRSTRP
jgi:hypothetical protein